MAGSVSCPGVGEEALCFPHYNGFYRPPYQRSLIALMMAIFVAGVNAIDIFLEWNVTLDNTIKPVSQDQHVCMITTTVTLTYAFFNLNVKSTTVN